MKFYSEKWWFPLDAYGVSWPTRKKNLKKSLIDVGYKLMDPYLKDRTSTLISFRKTLTSVNSAPLKTK